MLLMTLIICFLSSILLTPMIKKLAFRLGATDRPNQRKVHAKIMPRMGGLAIFISFMIGHFIMDPFSPSHTGILLGSLVIVITGILDDMYELSAQIKLFSQIAAALIVKIQQNGEAWKRRAETFRNSAAATKRARGRRRRVKRPAVMADL